MIWYEIILTQDYNKNNINPPHTEEILMLNNLSMLLLHPLITMEISCLPLSMSVSYIFHINDNIYLSVYENEILIESN